MHVTLLALKYLVINGRIFQASKYITFHAILDLGLLLQYKYIY